MVSNKIYLINNGNLQRFALQFETKNQEDSKRINLLLYLLVMQNAVLAVI
ncbi:hypothetical protein H1P_760004 [Hyella patelloides LEGE 07179]|uniref:Uncharacterized protein n=1 Tax=Hyella patelloides LEGE 07179 TaxID=945734 RepID=A0A563W3T9_9CYAN|nr:hypothetical protein H1P_760004 [Hyella patelloides LEGE 07179]